jgi:hypothetical protein
LIFEKENLFFGSSSFQSFLSAVRLSRHRLYLLIDEYDNFANEVLMGRGEANPTRYKALLSTEGSLKALFKRFIKIFIKILPRHCISVQYPAVTAKCLPL